MSWGCPLPSKPTLCILGHVSFSEPVHLLSTALSLSHPFLYHGLTWLFPPWPGAQQPRCRPVVLTFPCKQQDALLPTCGHCAQWQRVAARDGRLHADLPPPRWGLSLCGRVHFYSFVFMQSGI
jgi:hypothetical protein